MKVLQCLLNILTETCGSKGVKVKEKKNKPNLPLGGFSQIISLGKSK